MKKLANILFCAAFLLCLVLPALNMELGENVKSEIDNEYLPEIESFDPDEADTVLTNYVEKRIGFRKEALDLYQKINAALFGVMEHPTYMYGKEGHVFFKGSYYVSNYQHLNLNQDGAEAFADVIKGFQTYAEAQGKTFLYFLIPDKETVYSEYYPDTVKIFGEVSLADQVLAALEERSVNYFYAKDVMLQAKEKMPVNNVRYDAGHWNHNGAFVSLQALFELLQKDYPQIIPLAEEEFQIDQVMMESLQVSHFEINEFVPVYSLKETAAVNKTEELLETAIISFPDNYVSHYHNPDCADQPKLLIFGDSYLAGEDQFLINHFSEYTYIHRYNLYNQEFFEYYVELFDPDIIIFENPERSLLIEFDPSKTLE